MVTSSGGTSSARITKKVDAGGSSTYLRRMAPNWSMRWKSSSTSTLRLPSAGDRAACLTTASAVPRVDATLGRGRLHDVQVGVGLGQREADVALGVLALGAGREQQGRERPRGGSLAGAARAHEQVGVDRVDRRGRELGDGVVLPDDVRPHIDPGHGRHAASMPAAGAPLRRRLRPGRGSGWRRSPRSAAATSSSGAVPSTTAHRSGSAIACTRNPSCTRAWKASPGRLDPVLGPGQPALGVAGRHLEQDDEVGPEPVGGPAGELLDLGGARAAGRSPGRRSTTLRSGR